jgi:hypothetical protein
MKCMTPSAQKNAPMPELLAATEQAGSSIQASRRPIPPRRGYEVRPKKARIALLRSFALRWLRLCERRSVENDIAFEQ